MKSHRILTSTQARSCQIYIGDRVIETLLSQPPRSHSGRRFLVYDHNLADHAAALQNRIDFEAAIPLPTGEGCKSLTALEESAAALLAAKADREAVLVVLGGGAALDHGAFLASIYMRGIPCVLIPSSLLAMVDAGIGGKNGVHLGTTKNILGTIRQPDGIAIEPQYLATLDPERFKEGLVEIIKIAAIMDADFYAWIQQSTSQLKAREPNAIFELLRQAVELKCRVVEQDEREAGLRLMLNFGHSIGHALESASDFQISHGRAVAMGMLAELEICGQGQLKQDLKRTLQAFSIDAELPKDIMDRGVDSIWQFVLQDKKKRGGQPRMAVPLALGRGHVVPLEKNALAKLFK